MIFPTLTIKKKTKVPSRRQNVHLYRSDWKLAELFKPHDSSRIFQICETEAQFSKFLKDRYGTGIYLVLMNRKGIKGFKVFTKVEISDRKFRRLIRNPTPEEIELRKEKEERKILEQRKKSASYEERNEIEDEIQSSDEMISDIKGDIKKHHYFISGYLQVSIPVYSWHSLED